MKKLAIVFFYLGKQDYQWFTLNLAKKRNPDADVFLITDFPNEDWPAGVNIVDVAKYSDLINRFDAIYQHKNTCPRSFQLSSLSRWLVYDQWWRENPDYDLFVADCDVMIFSDLAPMHLIYMANCPYTLSMGTAAGQSFWSAPEPMGDLVDLMWRTYASPDSSEAQSIFQHYDNLQREGKPGGVCDMTFHARIKEELERCEDGPVVGETTEVRSGTFDHNVLMPQGYEYEDGRKKVMWKNGHPYCRREADGLPVLFHTLHMSCSGGLIKDYYCKAMEGFSD